MNTTGTILPDAAIPVTMVITSCRRHDLLEQTLRSFLTHNDYPLERILIIEDSDLDSVHDMKRLFPEAPIEIIVNGTQMGQLRSIDKAYSLVTTEYIFHCEDDWDFGRPGLIAESIPILQSDPDVLLVLTRIKEDIPYFLRSFREQELDAGQGRTARFRLIPPHAHQNWYTFTFNPGLRRLSDYKLVPGGYQTLNNEKTISQFYKRLNRKQAWLSDGQVRHIGDDRGHDRARRPFRLADRLTIWGQSLQRRLMHYGRVIGIGR